jgi:hypothetical protein
MMPDPENKSKKESDGIVGFTSSPDPWNEADMVGMAWRRQRCY